MQERTKKTVASSFASENIQFQHIHAGMTDDHKHVRFISPVIKWQSPLRML